SREIKLRKIEKIYFFSIRTIVLKQLGQYNRELCSFSLFPQ
ncbi:unnamed protein product, partial [marine sediment metagenome]